VKKWFVAASMIVLLFAAQRYCAADGFFFPAQNAKSPRMPQQRAIIVYRDGVERLIVESSFQGEAGQYAWIIPVPNQPIEIKSASYPLFKTLFYDFRQKVYDSRWWAIALFFFDALLLMFTMAWSLALLTGRSPAFSAWTSPLMILLLGTAFFRFRMWEHSECWLLALPVALYALVFATRNKMPKVMATIAYLPVALLLLVGCQYCRIGAFTDASTPFVTAGNVLTLDNRDVVTLKADNPGALDAWLTSGGFKGLGPEEERLAQDYINAGWLFVAALVRTPDSRLSTPCLIEISFAANAPVYPMRFTSLAGGAAYVDLTVISDYAYECEALRTEFTSAMRRYQPSDSFMTMGTWELGTWWKAAHSGGLFSWPGEIHSGHSESLKLMWDFCAVSKLSGTLAAEEMDKDIRPTVTSPGKMMTRATIRAELLAGLHCGVLFFILATLVATVILSFLYWLRERACTDPGRLYVVLLCLAAAVAFAVWMTAPATAAKKRSYYVRTNKEACQIVNAAFAAACNVPGGPAEKLKAMFDNNKGRWPEMNDEMRALLAQLGQAVMPALKQADVRNPLTNEPILVEESPGNFTIEMWDFPASLRLSGAYPDFLPVRLLNSPARE